MFKFPFAHFSQIEKGSSRHLLPKIPDESHSLNVIFLSFPSMILLHLSHVYIVAIKI
jgi:hypothetical protein